MYQHVNDAAFSTIFNPFDLSLQMLSM